MCGIIGCYREKGVTSEDLNIFWELLEKNRSRGANAYGIATPTKLYKEIDMPIDIAEVIDFLDNFVGEKFLFVHLRAPTGDGKSNLELTQPFVNGDTILLFNGILTEWDKQKYKNDTYSVMDHLNDLESLKGSFALCISNKDSIKLVRCINSLYYNDNFYSSEYFEGCKELKHGEILDFKTKEITTFKCYNPYEIK